MRFYVLNGPVSNTTPVLSYAIFEPMLLAYFFCIENARKLPGNTRCEDTVLFWFFQRQAIVGE